MGDIQQEIAQLTASCYNLILAMEFA